MKFRFTFSLILILLIAGESSAQRKRIRKQSLEFGVFLGGSNYHGDLTKDFYIAKEAHLAGGLLTRYNLSPYISLKGSAIYGQISGSDVHFPDDPFRSRRNLSFKSNILDFSAQTELNILGWNDFREKLAWTPYLFVGVSMYKFNPKAHFNDEWIELQPLGTEGQGTTQYNERKKYALTQMAIPFGAGLKFQLTNNLNLGFEAGIRKTFTDYLDDISLTYVESEFLQAAYGNLSRQLADRANERGEPGFSPGNSRGISPANDWYALAGVTVTYKILAKNVKCFRF